MFDDLNIDDYDYIDFGCSNGNSIRFGVDKFNGIKGIGVDIDPKKIANANERLKDTQAHRGEHIAINYDVLNLDDDSFYKKFRFTTCIHFLEHLFGFVDAMCVSAMHSSPLIVLHEWGFCKEIGPKFAQNVL